MKQISSVYVLSTVVAIFVISGVNLHAGPPVIDDQKLMEELIRGTGEVVGEEGVPSADDLATKAKNGELVKLECPVPTVQALDKVDYETLSKSVYLIDSIYKCGKCEKWHQGSTATAWCLSDDGLMVTNAHVFRGAKGAAMGVINREGLMFHVTELLGFDVAADVAVFRVNGKGMQPLKMGDAPSVGEAITIISNPSRNLFVRTEGAVSRYSLRQVSPKNQTKVPWMEVTADYAVGSSGGPVFNAVGEVVGMVSTTHSIHTGEGSAKGANKGDLQMVIKSCVPVDSIRALFKKD